MPQSTAALASAPPCAAAPDFLDLIRGDRALVEVEILDAFNDQCRVLVQVGKAFRQTFWVPRAKVMSVTGHDPVLNDTDENRIREMNLYPELR